MCPRCKSMKLEKLSDGKRLECETCGWVCTEKEARREHSYWRKRLDLDRDLQNVFDY